MFHANKRFRYKLLGLTAAILLAIWFLARGDSQAQRSPNRPETVALENVNNGQADATGLLQRLVDSGGTIQLPEGTFRISSTINVDLEQTGFVALHAGSATKIVNSVAGPAIRVVGTHQGTARPATMDATVWQRQRMPIIDGLAIEGDHPEADGIEARGSVQLTVSHCHFRQLRHGIVLRGNNRNLIVSDCHIYDNRGVGIYYDQVNLHQSNIVGCHISYNQRGGIVCRGGNVRNIHVSGCDLESNMSQQTEATANILIDNRGSQYGTAEVAISGCTIQHNHDAGDSANIRVIGNTRSSTGAVQQEGNITIVGNVLSDVQTNIDLHGCRGVTISANTFWSGFQYDLLVDNCTNIVLGPNVFDRNPRYRSDSARHGILLRNAQDCTLSGVHLTGVKGHPAGLHLVRCQRINMTGCTVLDCENAGLLLQEVEDVRLNGCLVRPNDGSANYQAIKVENSDRVTIDGKAPAR